MENKFLKEILLRKKKGIDRIEAGKIKINACSEPEFLKSMSPNMVNVIAEIKKASPLKGIINGDLDVARSAGTYNRFRDFISGLSVLTEELYFKGNCEDIRLAKGGTGLPILRKDFIFSEKQVYESATMGADCILLIKPLLGFNKLKRLYNCALEVGLDVLVETYNKQEFIQILDMGAELIGVNNRDLRGMKVDNNHIISVLENVPKNMWEHRIIICESGVKDIGYIERLFKMGVNTFLIGSYFMESPELEDTLLNFREGLKQKGLI